jgi:hypothetical protein
MARGGGEREGAGAVCGVMMSGVELEWQGLRRGRPGRRFQDRYRIMRRRTRGSMIGRIVRMIAAAAALAVGVVLVFMPGPAVLFFLVAGMLLATESLTVARLLDWGEVRGRRWGRWIRNAWRRLPVAGKIAAIAIAGAIVVAAGYGGYRVFLR